jgi:signal transduction histidine kinase
MTSFEPTLLLHNIGFGFGAIVAFIFAIYVYLKDPKATQNVTFALAFISIAIFCGSHVIGVNIKDPLISRNVLMWNISVIYIACFLAHCSFEVAGVTKKHKIFLAVNYGVAVILTIIYILIPDTFLLPSKPKMYFANYYVPGSLHWLMRLIYDVISPAYFLTLLALAYRKAESSIKNRLKYFFFSLTIGYITGSLAIPLVYDIPIDPVYAAFCVPILSIPMAYAIVKFNLLEIRVVAFRAFIYSIMVGLSTITLIGITTANQYLLDNYPLFPIWLIPTITSFISMGVAYLIWNRLKEIDTLKYEFLTIVTHKFRTPLTRVKWAIEELKDKQLSQDGQKDLQTISLANENLVELTSELVQLSERENEAEVYKYEKVRLSQFIHHIYSSYKPLFAEKKINFDCQLPETDLIAKVDEKKLNFGLQTILDNALAYTSKHGHVSFKLSRNSARNRAEISIDDSGIGMSQEEKNLVFEKFYRSPEARKADTEGIGIGLYMVKRIIERMDGNISISSNGLGTGTTVKISLPITN